MNTQLTRSVNHVCFSSLNYLTQYCEVSVRTVKRHVNEFEKQGFVKRIKRFDDLGCQRSNIYQLRLPNDSYIQQADLGQEDRDLDQTDHSDIHQGDSRSNTESDHLAHIIFHKEHKTELSLKNAILDDTDVLDPPQAVLKNMRSRHLKPTMKL